ncbi:hypothetical protein A6395_09545 [Exiguobacterium sp. SH31]|uniref:hypothetical protein n=1 Tax=unclassified Exiguobacterium TaxID=2644629 RepID=UPI0008CC9346|nr:MULTISPECIES: hypothetical protein [unclassified Exiguobacterium]OGX78885.1 hypothetical protein A6395_09545 [Exiguobacterium sp. SH31]
MSQLAIEVKGLVKQYKIMERDAGLKGAIKALFTRKYRIKEAVKGIDLSDHVLLRGTWVHDVCARDPVRRCRITRNRIPVLALRTASVRK